MLTWGVNDGQVGAEFVLDLDDDLLGPELLLALQASVLSLGVLLRSMTGQLQGSSTLNPDMPAPAYSLAHTCLHGFNNAIR